MEENIISISNLIQLGVGYNSITDEFKGFTLNKTSTLNVIKQDRKSQHTNIIIIKNKELCYITY